MLIYSAAGKYHTYKPGVFVRASYHIYLQKHRHVCTAADKHANTASHLCLCKMRWRDWTWRVRCEMIV